MTVVLTWRNTAALSSWRTATSLPQGGRPAFQLAGFPKLVLDNHLLYALSLKPIKQTTIVGGSFVVVDGFLFVCLFYEAINLFPFLELCTWLFFLFDIHSFVQIVSKYIHVHIHVAGRLCYMYIII